MRNQPLSAGLKIFKKLAKYLLTKSSEYDIMLIGDIMIKNKEIDKKLISLEVKYRKDPEALEEIERAKETIIYHEKRGEDEKAASAVVQLEAFLHDWY